MGFNSVFKGLRSNTLQKSHIAETNIVEVPTNGVTIRMTIDVKLESRQDKYFSHISKYFNVQVQEVILI